MHHIIIVWSLFCPTNVCRNGEPLHIYINDVYGPVIPAISFCRNKSLTLQFRPFPQSTSPEIILSPTSAQPNGSSPVQGNSTLKEGRRWSHSASDVINTRTYSQWGCTCTVCVCCHFKFVSIVHHVVWLHLRSLCTTSCVFLSLSFVKHKLYNLTTCSY